MSPSGNGTAKSISVNQIYGRGRCKKRAPHNRTKNGFAEQDVQDVKSIMVIIIKGQAIASRIKG